ncbi:MAG: choice-of-anchor D domain-containing protein [Bacteroidota bacterium]|nr:choice-of-anchor D domain-containing protein [Candidatus Kapabacteria bacterium]MCX7936226.1 choice-of-anchor D domain-containing protein [Chlorobiota bacterium]MDW8074493.1 choice-of-anchor D domain-containing protein [Bacteroidota bacterium]
MYTIRILAILMFTVLFAYAQRREILEGREYYFGIPHCDYASIEYTRGIPIQLWLSSRVPTKVRISIPRTGQFLGQYNLSPRRTHILSIPEILMNKVSGIADNGIYIQSEQPITATVYVSYRWSGEAFKIIPKEQLGRVYYTLNLYQDHTDRERVGQILITATKDNTRVAVTPKVDLDDGTRGGQTRVYTLQAGQTLLLKAKIKPGFDQDFETTDLTGTKITASAPISVISGHTKGAFPRFSRTMLGTPANFMRNMLVESMWPAEFLGREYFSAPIMYADRPPSPFDSESGGDLIRIVAAEDNTIVSYRRRSDNTWQQVPKVLKAGERYDFTGMEEPCLYKSNKPILIGHYGKAWRLNAVPPIIGKKGIQDQNPSRNGQGMMLVLTPREQWATYTTFYSPPEIDNFVMITFLTKYVDSILFDGAKLRTRFGTGIRPVAGSDFSYAVGEVGPGDHTIESLSPNAKFTAYVYGNWDRSKDGFAYGYPTGINFALACEDSITLEATQHCGRVEGIARALPENADCAQMLSVELNPDVSTNYQLELQPEKDRNPREMHFTLVPIDQTKPAIAEVIATTRSGKYIVRRFEYMPELHTVSPAQIDFGALAIGSSLERVITITNTSTEPITITSISLKNNKAEFQITATSKPLPTTLAPNERLDITIRATARQVSRQAVVEDVVVTFTCTVREIPLRLQAGKGCIGVTDVTFPAIPVGTESSPSLKCRITNTSSYAVTIFGIEYNGQNDPYPGQRYFRDDFSALNPPLKLEGGQSVEFNVWFTPPDVGTMHSLEVKVISDAEDGCSDKTSIWSGIGIDAGPIISGHDFGIVRVLDRYNVQVNGITHYGHDISIGAVGSAGTALLNPTLKLEAVTLPAGVDDPSSAFQLNLTGVPAQLFAGTTHRLPVRFTPSVTGEYVVKVILSGTFNGELRSASALLKGTAVVPVQDSLGWGVSTPQPLGTVVHGVAHIYNTGTMNLTVSDLKIIDDNAGAFQIDPTWYASTFASGAIVIPPNGERAIDVIFVAKRPGLQTARIEVTCDLMPDERKYPILYGVGEANNSNAEATSYDFGNVYKCNSKASTTDLFIRNTGESRLTIVDVQPSTPETSQLFFLLNQAALIGKTIEPGQNSEALHVEFRPPYVPGRERQAIRYESNTNTTYAFDWTLRDEANRLLMLRSYVSGTGVDMVVTVTTKPLNAPHYTIQEYQYDKPLEYEFNILDRPSRIDDARLTTFHAYVYYDPLALSPEEGIQNIITTGTLTDGWKVRKAVINKPGEFEVEMEEPTHTRPLQGTGTLFKFKMRAFFSTKEEDQLPCAFDPTGSTCWVLVDSEPGRVLLPKVCANDLRHVIVSLDQFQLFDPEPNPSNGSTINLRFSIGYEAPTQIQLINALGEVVRKPLDRVLKPGIHEIAFDVSDLPSGMYIVRMISGQWIAPTKSLIISR